MLVCLVVLVDRVFFVEGRHLWAGGGIFGHSVAAAMIINSVL